MGALHQALLSLPGAGGISSPTPPVSGMTYWLDANQETSYSNGGTVEPILDWSGNANNISQATSTQRAKWDTGMSNGRPAYRFDGIDDFMDLPVTVSDSAWTLYVVLRPQQVNNTGNRTIIGPGLTSGVQIRIQPTTQKIEFTVSATSVPFASSGGLSTSAFKLLTIARDATSSVLRFNGVQDGTFSTATLNPFARLGYANTGNPAIKEQYEGWVSELILYPSRHDATQLANTDGWLMDPSRHNL
jgi:hypothetical protein